MVSNQKYYYLLGYISAKLHEVNDAGLNNMGYNAKEFQEMAKDILKQAGIIIIPKDEGQ